MKISNPKHQISNKSQIRIFNDQNGFEILNFVIGICLEIVIWYLGFFDTKVFTFKELQYPILSRSFKSDFISDKTHPVLRRYVFPRQ